MRSSIAVIIPGVIVLLVGYTVWPIYDLYRIASAVETRNLVALQEWVDFPSLRVSLIKQINDAYRKKSDESGLSVGAGVGVVQISRPELLLDLLGRGSVSTDPSLRSSLAAPFTSSSFGSPWQVWLNSDYSGTTFYVTVPVHSPSDQHFQIKLRLLHWRWKLLALDLPESTKAHLVEVLLLDNQPPAH
jgi:hypothetical protein